MAVGRHPLLRTGMGAKGGGQRSGGHHCAPEDGRMKLTLDEVRVVSRMRERGASVRRLAKDLGVRRERCGIGWSVWGRERDWMVERVRRRRWTGMGRRWKRSRSVYFGFLGSRPWVRLIYEAWFVTGSGELPVRALSGAACRGSYSSGSRRRECRRSTTVEERVPIARRPELELFLGTLSYSRAFCWPSEDQTRCRGTPGSRVFYEGVPLGFGSTTRRRR